MKKADLHVHSQYSAHPSEWFLQRLGTRESYTKLEEIYHYSKKRGMDYVTLTDHNTIEGSLLLKEMYPGEVFTGVEVTTYFPEDKCKIHVLVYGLNENQFHEINRIRPDIYILRDFLKQENLAHSVAHATFNINKKLTESHIEKLFLLFDYFEAINGARTQNANSSFHILAQSLTEDHISRFFKKHKIQPFSDTSWVKGFTAGSDDHSGMFIAETYTKITSAATVDDFLLKLKEKQSIPEGRSNDYQGFTFSIYKIAYDFSKNKSGFISKSLMGSINQMLIDGKSMGIGKKFALTKMKFGKQNQKNDLRSQIISMVDRLDKVKHLPAERKTAEIYDSIAGITDELLKSFLHGIQKNLQAGDIGELLKSISGAIPIAFLSFPYLSTISILNESRQLQDNLDSSFGLEKNGFNKKILWFTDTLTDLNGPSETIQKLAWMSNDYGLNLIPVTCLLEKEKSAVLPPQIIDLPVIWSYTPEEFSMYTLRIPSILKSVKIISEQCPDEILISTPGPIGLLGLLIAKILHIPCRAIYHTDFAEQAIHILDDESVHKLIDDYQRWFHSLCDEIKVPTREYISILSKRGFNRSRMSVFMRGIEQDVFKPVPDARAQMERIYGIPQTGFTLLYTGRISREKHADFIAQIYERVSGSIPDVNLVFCGSGPEPYFSSFKKSMQKYPNVFFTGRLLRKQLPVLYSGSDLFLFPSTTDTFGMVVLEAQACGLPVLVSDVGGPKEIIIDKLTGKVLKAGALNDWIQEIGMMMFVSSVYPEKYLEMRSTARKNIIKNYDWDRVLGDLFRIDLIESKFSNKISEPVLT